MLAFRDLWSISGQQMFLPVEKNSRNCVNYCVESYKYHNINKEIYDYYSEYVSDLKDVTTVLCLIR